MTPTPDQACAGWTTLPDRETWDAHVARGGVWQYMMRNKEIGINYVRHSNYDAIVVIDRVSGPRLYRPIDPHTGNHWPLPGAASTEPCPTVECQDLIEYVDAVCDDMTDNQFEGACKALMALWNDFDFVRRKRG